MAGSFSFSALMTASPTLLIDRLVVQAPLEHPADDLERRVAVRGIDRADHRGQVRTARAQQLAASVAAWLDGQHAERVHRLEPDARDCRRARPSAARRAPRSAPVAARRPAVRS